MTLEEELAQAERDEEWALLVLLAWLALLVFIVVVLLLSPVPWGALVGLIFWAWAARSVYRRFSDAVARTAELRESSEDTDS